MKPHLVTAAAALAWLVVPRFAGAQEAEKPTRQRNMTASSEAFEATVATGYTQPFGMLKSGVGMPDVAKAGLGIDLSAGYRVDTHWGVSLGGQYQELDAQNSLAATRGVAFTLAAQYHIVPTTHVDPWVELGTGYRLLWEVQANNQPTVLDHGVQLARVRAGLDFRPSPDVAISPVVGADATVFLWQDQGTSVAIADPRVSTFIFAGVQGRIDMGGTKVGTATTTTSRPVESE